MKPPRRQMTKQPTPQELMDSCLGLLRSKFYAGDDRCFAQDRKKLLQWVVLWPAAWLNNRGVTLHGDQYREIFVTVFLNAAAHVQSKIKYRPAYLRQVIQEHFKHHGEKYYDQGKTVRNAVENALFMAGKPSDKAPDPVKDMALARQFLATVKPKKTASKTPVKTQLNLFG
jgi:hypothetical protein